MVGLSIENGGGEFTNPILQGELSSGNWALKNMNTDWQTAHLPM